MARYLLDTNVLSDLIRLPDGNVAKKVAASCKDRPGMMVHEVMENVMPRTSVMPR